MLNSNKIKAVIFDFDDTLVASFEFYGKAYRRVAKSYGFEITREDQRKYWGTPANETIMGILRSVDTLETLKAKLFDNLDEQVPAFPYTVEIVQQLIKANYKLAIVSSGLTDVVKNGLISAGFGLDPFETILGSDITKFDKPDSRVFNPVIDIMKERYDITLGEMLYVGDSLFDYKATVGTPMQFRGVLTGVTIMEQFLVAGADREMIMEGIDGLRELL